MKMNQKERTEYAIRSGLPRRHVETIEQNRPLETKVLYCRDKVCGLVKERNCVLVRGEYGSGKTHMACDIGYWWPGEGKGGVMYRTVCGLLIETKESFGKKDVSSPVVKAMGCGLLILDELLANTGSVFDNNTIRELIDTRYRNLKPTIILTNLDDSGLLQALDQATIDRMFDGGCVIQLKGKSLRATKGKK